MHYGNDELARAFPATLHNDVAAVLTVLPEPQHPSQGNEISLNVVGEIVSLPFRLYHDPALINTDGLTGLQKEIVDCLLTRHYDGSVRQVHLAQIIRSKNVWTLPFVVQLLGEYVIEILRLIHENLSVLDALVYSQFLRANPEFLAITQQRVVSYWNCYYRAYRKEDYVGFQVLEFFKSLTKNSC
jgi:hypothetical protein